LIVDDALARFEHPPVSEVVLGAQFAKPVVDLEVLANFAVRVKEALPARQQHEALVPTEESFAPPARAPRIQVRAATPVMPRTWFISADERQLVQLQGDRLVLNWRRMNPADRYPSYETLRPVFEGYLTTLEACLNEAGRSPFPVNLAEVTYINELAWPDVHGTNELPPLSRAIRAVTNEPAGGFLPRPENQGIRMQYLIPSLETGSPAGRLHVVVDPALRSTDQKPIYLLKMTANIVSTMFDRDSLIRALDLGHTWAVNAFGELTTTELQELWHPLTLGEA
jgi:uncharacterized protein (TIGR04255 family)